jgi:hypothetical protein
MAAAGQAVPPVLAVPHRAKYLGTEEQKRLAARREPAVWRWAQAAAAWPVLAEHRSQAARQILEERSAQAETPPSGQAGPVALAQEARGAVVASPVALVERRHRAQLRTVE